ncbi:hypothetical protein [Nonomuraea sp. SYSU D8015]|uniref:hypothetical protein n=1 Tax=Nonomuraea sp. SYSU D8015 TaxID=2593644 RepID=UPI00166079F4|nr:hypothetical protein [Nonomuraea sp. SYSU D8015]
MQSTFDLNQNSGNHAAEVAKGAWETTTGLAGMLWEFSEVRKTIDPDGWQRQVEDSAKGILYGIKNPLEMLKAITDWDTWATNPDRAFGRLVPDLLAAAATAGGSSAASGASKAVTALDKITDLLKVAKAKAGPQVAPARIRPDGTWEWKGVSLDRDVNALADQAIARARKAEPDISRGVQAAGREVGAEMAGFPKHVLKGPDRYKEKLAKLIKRFPNRTPEELIRKEMHDGIRYTFTFSEDRYADGVANVKTAMEGQGFKLVLQKPAWDDPSAYKGVNMRWRSPDGHLLEVQIHTPQSLWAKEVTHEVYEYKGYLGAEDVERLEKYEKEIFKAVPVPPGATKIPTLKKDG